jgi:hypothetical protein
MADEENKEKVKEEQEEEKEEGASTGEEQVEETEVEAPSVEGDTTEKAAEKEGPEGEEEKELSEEELRKLIEESLEDITVTDIILSMMNQLASVAYLKMGMPDNVNLKYRDFDQAKLAIDSLDAIIAAAEGKVEGKGLEPFKGTLANLKMNFVQLKRSTGS